MSETHNPPLEQLWRRLLVGDDGAVADLVDPEGTWDDPLFNESRGEAVRGAAVPRIGAWYRERTSGAAGAIQHLRTTADEKRVVVESVLALKDGLVWNQAQQKAEKAPLFELAVAVVGDRSGRSTGAYGSIRVYFGTWAVLDGAPRVRVGPVAPDERANTARAIDALPTVRRYFDYLAVGDPRIIEEFEPDGYFREPANNYACGRDQLGEHFTHILSAGGVGIEFLTATRQDSRLAIELQTITWGTKKMSAPQAGFACYELGPHDKIQGSRVYDSVVPPEL
jgi:hypothetical protein